jgi:hypothetical protein
VNAISGDALFRDLDAAVVSARERFEDSQLG